MSNTQGTLALIAAAITIAPALPSTGARPAAAAAASQPWKRFSADVSIRRGVHGQGHQPEGSEGPAILYRWERRHEGGRWKSTIRVVTSGRASVMTPAGNSKAIPPVIDRIEDDEDGTGARFYTSAGTLVSPPSIRDRWKMGVGEGVFARSDALAGPAALFGPLQSGDQHWLDAILPSSGLKRARSERLQRRYGKPLGTVGGRERYVHTSEEETTEVLADAEWAIPIEVHVVRRGTLTSRASFSYEPGAGGSLVRRRSRAEHLIPDGNGARMVLDVELANVKLEDRM